MCGRYYVASEDQSEELRAIISEVQRRSKEQLKLGKVYTAYLQQLPISFSLIA